MPSYKLLIIKWKTREGTQIDTHFAPYRCNQPQICVLLVRKKWPTLLFGASANHQGESQRTSCSLEGALPTPNRTTPGTKKFHRTAMGNGCRARRARDGIARPSAAYRNWPVSRRDNGHRPHANKAARRWGDRPTAVGRQVAARFAWRIGDEAVVTGPSLKGLDTGNLVARGGLEPPTPAL